MPAGPATGPASTRSPLPERPTPRWKDRSQASPAVLSVASHHGCGWDPSRGPPGPAAMRLQNTIVAGTIRATNRAGV